MSAGEPLRILIIRAQIALGIPSVLLYVPLW